jgi:hypothetical protein
MLAAPAPPPRSALLVALMTALVAVLGGLAPTAADAAPSTPTSIVIDAVSSDVLAPTGTPDGAVPYVLVQAGEAFSVSVRFLDASGAPAAFTTDTALALTSNRGALTPSTGLAPKGATSATLTTSLAVAANQVSLTVSVAGGRGARTVAPGTSRPDQLFDVVSQLRKEDAAGGVAFQQGIGGDSNCAVATVARPVCGIVVLPNGAASSQVLLSLGVCDAAYAGCGSTKGSVVQTLADLTGLYTRSAPATLLVKCDKSLCGGGAVHGQRLSFSLLGNAPLGAAPDCPAKGIIDATQTACVDYVVSRRDGSGDTYLNLLFTEDARVSVG